MLQMASYVIDEAAYFVGFTGDVVDDDSGGYVRGMPPKAN
jgi:hypothetical protein